MALKHTTLIIIIKHLFTKYDRILYKDRNILLLCYNFIVVLLWNLIAAIH